MSIRVIIVALLLAQLSACSLFRHKRECNGADCYAPRLLENSQVAHKWYCYGQETGKWKCLNKPDKKLIAAIKPKVQGPVNPDQIPGSQNPIAFNKREVHIQPPTNITNSILDQDKNSYTVQLTAAHSEKALMEYAREHNVTQPLYVVVPSDNGQTYLLILGIYKDQDKAIDAREFWERTRRVQEEPWVRRLGPLQSQIKAKDQGN